jgi:hypothetical protein
MQALVQLQAPSDVGGKIQAPNGTYAVPAGGVISVDPRDVPFLLGLGFAFLVGGSSPANPTATAGPAAIDGSASTYMRSDAAPAIQLGSAAQKGIVQVDNTTITAVEGVISSAPSGIKFTDGTHTVNAATKLTVTGGTVGGSTPNATLDISGGGGGISLPLPFLGASNPPWTRPSLSDFDTLLNVTVTATGVRNVISYGTGYAPNDVSTLAGGTGTPAMITITDTQVVSAAIVNPGSLGTPGGAQVIGTTGVGDYFVLDVTIGGDGAISSIDDINTGGDYTTNPTLLTAEPVADNSSSGITGAVVSIAMGALAGSIDAPGSYTSVPRPMLPDNTPLFSEASSTGGGTGATWELSFSGPAATITDGADGAPLAFRVQATSSDPSTTGGNVTGLLMALPEPPFTWTIGVANVISITAGITNNWVTIPILLWDSANAAAVTANWAPGQISFTYYENTALGHGGTQITYFAIPEDYFFWLRLVYDAAGNLNFYFSSENVEYLPIYSRSATADTPSIDHIGFGIDSAVVGKSSSTMVALWNLVQSSP